MEAHKDKQAGSLAEQISLGFYSFIKITDRSYKVILIDLFRQL